MGELRRAGVEALEHGAEVVADRGDDRRLGLAVRVRPGLRLGLPHEALVGVHAHEDVLGLLDRAHREAGGAAVRHGVRDRLDARDPHGGALRVDPDEDNAGFGLD